MKTLTLKPYELQPFDRLRYGDDPGSVRVVKFAHHFVANDTRKLNTFPAHIGADGKAKAKKVKVEFMDGLTLNMDATSGIIVDRPTLDIHANGDVTGAFAERTVRASVMFERKLVRIERRPCGLSSSEGGMVKRETLKGYWLWYNGQLVAKEIDMPHDVYSILRGIGFAYGIIPPIDE